MSEQQPRPGWYPLHNDPGTERYWDGHRWSEHHRIRSNPPSQNGGGSSGGKVILGVLIGIFLLLGGCIASTALLVGGTVDAIDELSDLPPVPGDSPGSVANPLRFGERHERPFGFGGSAWSVSVEEVRTLDNGCLAVVGSAVLDRLTSDRTVSAPSSFPEITLVTEDRTSFQPTDCGNEALRAEGLVWAQDTEVVEGTEFDWFETFTDQDYRFVSVSGTFYEN